MRNTSTALCGSLFIREHLSDFLDRYQISCSKENLCCDYCILNRGSNSQISSSLILSLNTYAKQIHVSRFYPELYKEPRPKYLSATCFYLLVHHFAQTYGIGPGYRIFLETRAEVYQNFYKKLGDFQLNIKKPGLGSNNLDIWGDYLPSALQTSDFFRNANPSC